MYYKKHDLEFVLSKKCKYWTEHYKKEQHRINI
jgi:hypothetical protein